MAGYFSFYAFGMVQILQTAAFGGLHVNLDADMRRHINILPVASRNSHHRHTARYRTQDIKIKQKK